jgi:hypothetical protein
MSRFEKTDSVRYPLGSEDFVMIRRRLSGAEKRRMHASAFTDLSGAKGDTQIGVDFSALGLARVYAYLTDWGGPGFLGEDGKTVKCTREAIDALDEDTLKAITEVIDAHVTKTADETKAPSGVPASSQG